MCGDQGVKISSKLWLYTHVLRRLLPGVNSSAAVRCSGRHFCTTRAVLRRNKSAGTGGPVLILLVVSLVANKALALLGEEIGMFVDRKELGKPGEFSRMSDEELEWFIQAPI